MFGSSTFDIAIGIVFVFLLLSLLASTINEFILSLLNMRGKELLRGLKVLLDDADAKGLVKEVYNHSQVFGLFQGDFDPTKPGNLPSYIPPENFVMALFDAIPSVAQTTTQPAAIQQDAAAMVASLRAAAQKLAGEPQTERIGKSLVSLIDAAGSDVAKLKKSIESWYNSAMDRVSGWYKYRTQKILFIIGFVLAVTLNADTVRIVKQLSQDATLRQSIVAAAQSAKPPDITSGQSIKDQIAQTQKQVSQIENLGIPLGRSPGQSGTVTWQTALGWLLTAIAVSLGAPFWFDMLNKIMVVRSTVKPREKSQEEESKDKEKK